MNANITSKEIKTEVVDESFRDKWNLYLRNQPYSIAWHSWDWHHVVIKQFPHQFFPLAALRADSIIGVFPLYRLDYGKHRNALISVPFAVAGGIVADTPEIENLLLKESINLSKTIGTEKIVMKQYKRRIEGDLRTDDTYFNRELSLKAGPDTLWNNLNDKNRELIRLAQKDNLTLQFPCNDLALFYKLVFRHHHRMGIPCVSKKYVSDLVDSKMYSTAVIYSNSKPLAATMVKEYKKSISFPFSAQYYDNDQCKRALYKLYWDLIKNYCDKGFEIFHSGRMPANEDVPEYRLGWGGEQHNYYYQYYPNTTLATESSKKRGWKRTLFTNAWKSLPGFIANSVSPFVIKNFP